MNILLVDDELDLLDFYEALLLENDPDMRIDKAIDGLDAFCLCKDKNYDIILTDFKMPLMDGVSFTMALREKDNECARSPVIFISANIPRAKELTQEMSNLYFLEKPFKKNELLRLVKMVSAGTRLKKLDEH